MGWNVIEDKPLGGVVVFEGILTLIMVSCSATVAGFMFFSLRFLPQEVEQQAKVAATVVVVCSWGNLTYRQLTFFLSQFRKLW